MPVRRALRVAVDVVVVLWALVWIVIGVQVGESIASLSRFGDTLVLSADALDGTADGLDRLSGVPFVGGRIADIAEKIEDTAASIRTRVREAKTNVTRLSYLLGSAIATIPSLPILAFYLPGRVRRWRERRRVLADLGDASTRDDVRRYLALQALIHLPYHRLRQLSDTPWADFEEGRYDALAAGELERLGIPR